MFQVLKGLDWAHRNILREFECSAFMKHIENVSCLAGTFHLKGHQTKGFLNKLDFMVLHNYLKGGCSKVGICLL